MQNQNLLDIEIILVDDASQDNGVNGVNIGTLYTKRRGDLNAKRAYIISLNQDNLYVIEYTFSYSYEET